MPKALILPSTVPADDPTAATIQQAVAFLGATQPLRRSSGNTLGRSPYRRMARASLSRQRIAALTQVMLVSTLLARDGSAGAAAVDAFEETVPLGSKQCPLDISVLWTADVDSPVYSTPVIRPSSVDGRKQVRAE